MRKPIAPGTQTPVANISSRDELTTAGARELAPTGTLTVGVVIAVHPGVFFVARNRASGGLRGVTASLGAMLANQMGVPVTYVGFPNSGACTEAVHSGAVDVAFMPVDALRREKVAFGPAYYLLESTYLVTASSKVSDLAGVDAPHIRVIGIANTTTIRAATRVLKRTVPVAIESVEAAFKAMQVGEADAMALSRDSLMPLQADLPGSQILDGGFQQTSISIAVPLGRPAALAYVSAFLEEAKASGVVRRAFDAAGLHDEPVAPLGQ